MILSNIISHPLSSPKEIDNVTIVFIFFNFFISTKKKKKLCLKSTKTS